MGGTRTPPPISCQHVPPSRAEHKARREHFAFKLVRGQACQDGQAAVYFSNMPRDLGGLRRKKEEQEGRYRDHQQGADCKSASLPSLFMNSVIRSATVTFARFSSILRSMVNPKVRLHHLPRAHNMHQSPLNGLLSATICPQVSIAVTTNNNHTDGNCNFKQDGSSLVCTERQYQRPLRTSGPCAQVCVEMPCSHLSKLVLLSPLSDSMLN